MVLFLSVCVMALLGPSQDEVLLQHVYREGDVQRFAHKVELSGETRIGELLSWLPSKTTVTKEITIKVLRTAPAGTADIRFEDDGENIHYAQYADEPPYDDKREPFWIVATISPTNELLHVFDIAKPKEKDEDKDARVAAAGPAPAAQDDGEPRTTLASIVMPLMTFPGVVEFGPKLPYHPVKPGDTWQVTVETLPVGGYRPGAVGSVPGSRIDFTYKYDGLAKWNEKDAWSITGTFSADIDLMPELMTQLPVTLRMLRPFKSASIKATGMMRYYLDPANGDVRHIEGTSSGTALLEAVERFTAYRQEYRLQSRVSLDPKKTN